MKIFKSTARTISKSSEKALTANSQIAKIFAIAFGEFRDEVQF